MYFISFYYKPRWKGTRHNRLIYHKFQLATIYILPLSRLKMPSTPNANVRIPRERSFFFLQLQRVKEGRHCDTASVYGQIIYVYHCSCNEMKRSPMWCRHTTIILYTEFQTPGRSLQAYIL